MNTRTKKIYAALDQLCDALDLGRSESSTERLFFILARAFNADSVAHMSCFPAKNFDEGLCIDMRGPIADKIQEVSARFEAE